MKLYRFSFKREATWMLLGSLISFVIGALLMVRSIEREWPLSLRADIRLRWGE